MSLSTFIRYNDIEGVNRRDENGDTPLIVAVMDDRLEMVKLLVSHGADVNIGNRRTKDTPLLEAVRYGSMEMVRYLLSHGARVNVANKYGDTPLMIAIIRRRGEGVVRLLLDHGADVNSRDENGYTPLMTASRLGDMSMVSLLLQHRANPWIVGNDGETAYSLATSIDVKNLLGTQSSSLVRRRTPYNDISIHTYE